MFGGGVWIDEVIENTVRNYNGRKIVIWGCHETSEMLAIKLETEHNIIIEFFVDSDKSKQRNANPQKKKIAIYSPDILKNKSKEYYIIIPLGRYKSIIDLMNEYGYKKDSDYNYFTDCVITDNEDYYEDMHGNKIYGNHENFKFVFMGYNSEIVIKYGARICKNTGINILNNSKLYIDNDSEIYGSFSIGNNSKVIIGNNARIISSNIHIGDYANLSIGNGFTVGSSFYCFLCDYTSIIIGNDCMFSSDIVLQSNDAHSIFDIKTGKNINSTKKISEKRKIIIGNHVWLGRRAIVLYNTEIGDGSIIGAGSIVKGVIPNNCIAAGNIARVIRKDVSWSRNNMAEDILDCGEEYINLTKE